ncbi:type III-B CRISPR module RAMP protein Cmr6 [Stygiolobus caldivivus]|uniref:Type III-B CRISPR module RAMP protein Cmr6 n=1 Tax=Stygiolobus caldivivus TaxID=2824673 RepID=A0A8D5U6T2_9CREN|nr:type III-B CRISPR module RAMP protein Cmr6 [Stygiolobus caldivivus]BCU70043.1 type III-B CRISPR module RAMP protein Cmr6 [Stygiolobus caldivivus]
MVGSKNTGDGKNFMLTVMKKVKEEYMSTVMKKRDEEYKAKKRDEKHEAERDEDITEAVKKEVMKTALEYDFTSKVRLANAYMDEVVTALKSMGLSGVDVRGEVSTKLLSGSAAGFLKLIYEVGMHWDPVMDLPFIPGSSIKGVMRSNALDLCMGKGQGVEECIKVVLDVFGSGEGLGGLNTEAKAGEVIVTNAYPVELSDNMLFTGDIVNPHYFKDGRPVTDEYDVEPVPISSLAIRKGVKFRFVIGVKEVKGLKEVAKSLFGYELDKPSEFIFLLLTYSLSMGLGARTSRGYGVMDVPVSSINLW